MAETIGDIVVRVGADIGDFVSGMRTANTHLSGMERAAKLAGAAAGVLTSAISATGVATVALMRSSMDAAGEIDRLSRAANSAPDTFQRWASAAKTVGVDQEKLADILKDVNDKVGDFKATGGGGMADFFENVAPLVGVTADQFARLSGPEALQLYVSSLEKAGASQQDMTFYLEALASDATSLLPLLKNNGSEMQRLGQRAQDLGAILSGDTIASLNATRVAVADIGVIISSVGAQIASELAPSLASASTRFHDMVANGGQLQDSISKVATSIGDLADVLLSPQFLNAASTFGSGLLTVVGGLADAFVLVVRYGEELAAILAAAGGAIYILGGPLTWVIGLISAAAAAFYAMKGGGDVAEASAYKVRNAEAALNAELNTFSQSSNPTAREESRKRVISLKEHAMAALAAAQAELALASAQAEKAASYSDLSGQDLLNASAGAGAGMSDYIDGILPDEKVRAASARAAELKAQIQEITAALKDMDASGGGSGGVTPTALPPGSGLGINTDPGGSAASAMSARLEALQNELSTERELIEAWYQESLDTINGATDAQLEALGGRHAAIERLEQEHQDRLAGIRDMANQWSVQSALDGGAMILGALGQTNKKALKLQGIFSAASALISTYQGAAEELKKGTFGFASAAAVIARGIGFVAAIKSASSGGSASRASASAAAPVAPPEPTRTSNITINGDVIGRQTGASLIKEINEAQKAGYRINLEWA